MSTPFRIQHLVKAPRKLVWAVYTQPQHLPNWFGPKGCTMPHCELDFRVGGRFLYCLNAADGTEMWGCWHFREINAPEKLVLLQSFSSAQGDATRHPMAPVWPLFTRSTTTLTEQDGGTLLTLEWAPHEASDAEQAVFAASHASLNQGWSGTFEQLESYLSLLQTP